MAEPIVECVPNFSEGRDPRIVTAIAEAIAGVPGVFLLGSESDVDHNRSVMTFVGSPSAVARGALQGIAAAVERIDLRSHTGAHPRIGAVDVVPFVPVRGVTLEDCVALAIEVAKEIWRVHRVPVYLYEAAARVEERRRLENIRRGGLEWLREHIAERPPDVGNLELHPTAGATVVGARKFLVAFNVNLDSEDLTVAQSVARAVRQSSGGLPSVKAMGVALASRGCVQVSMNLTDFEQTGLAEAFDAVRIEAARQGVEIAGTELVGLVPRRAWEQAAARLLQCQGFTADRLLENRLDALFSPLDRVLADISDPASPMGGGSAAALGAALGSALGCMVASLSHVEVHHFEAHREFFAGAAQRDANAFQQVLLARKAAEPERSAALQAAYRLAATVPAEMTERAKQLDRDLLELKEKAHPKLHPDVMTALGLSRAARAGGIAAAKANLQQIDDLQFCEEIVRRLENRPVPKES